MSGRATSCGVLAVSDGLLLLGQATGSARWDIPKGLREDGETTTDAAVRELREETGLVAEAAGLLELGVWRYLPAKDLTLFVWRPAATIDPAALRCTSMFRARDGRMVPELARFALLTWAEALTRVGKNMARVLGEVGEGVLASPFPPPPAGGV